MGSAMVVLQVLLALSVTALLFGTLRLISILPAYRGPPRPRKRGDPAHLLIVLGSGGHTAEMLSMLRNAIWPRKAVQSNGDKDKASATLNWRRYTHRTWVVSSGDAFSAARAREFEEEAAARYGGKEVGTWTIVMVPRARRIHQSLLTTPVSALNCLWECLQLLCLPERNAVSKGAKGSKDVDGLEIRTARDSYPDLILTNGPATATIVVLASLILRFFNMDQCNTRGKMRTVYVESWARVKKLSLSGKLLCQVVDRFLVQWEQLDGVGGRGEYLGVLV